MPTYNHCPPSSQEYCFNGGECFYLSEDPSVYICSCFMPFYGPQCEHEAPKPGAISTVTQTVSKEDPEGAVRRSVDRAMTITALIFIVVTFLGLLLLAWYLSRRRQKDYAQWKRIRQQSPVESVRARQTMDRGVQVQTEESDRDLRPLYHTKQSSYEADMEQELSEIAPTGMRDSFDRRNEMEAVEESNQTNELERRKRSLEEIFQEIDPVEDPSPTKQPSNRSQTGPPETRDQSIRPDHPQEHSRLNRKQPIRDQKPNNGNNIDSMKDEGPSFEEKTIPSRSLYKSGQELTDMQLKSMIEELSEMDQEDEPADFVSPKSRVQASFDQQQPSTSPKPPNVQVEDNDVGVSTASSSTPSTVVVNQPSITVDQATRQALNEQYRLGLKRITTNITPVEDNSRRYHTLTHVGRASSARPVPEVVHTTYVNAIEVQDLVHYTRLTHMHADQGDGSGLYLQSSVPVEELRRGDSLCRTHTLPRPTVSPLWIETHQIDRQPTPIQEPFTVASQHDALLSELYNRGSGDPLITSNPDIV